MDRRVARRRLDERLAPWRELGEQPVPARGWVRALRDALGMSAADLGRRADVDQSRITRIEQGEVTGAVQLDTLQRVARAMGCRVVYALVPEEPLEQMVADQARRRAAAELSPVTHTMALEDQQAAADHDRELRDDLAADWVDRRGLWS